MRHLALLLAIAACGTDVRPEPEPEPVTVTTWYQDVGPIVAEHCAGCHREGGLAPFTLTSYDDAVDRAGQMLAAVEAGVMPPWGATTATDCAPTRRWKHDPRLSPDQIATLRAWIDDGMPAGDSDTLPTPPDLGLAGITHSLTPTTPYVTTGSTDEFVCFVLDPQTTTTKYLEGWHVRPGNPEVVHHVIVQTITPEILGLARTHDLVGKPVPCAPLDMTQVLGAWAPGQGPMEAPAGVGLSIEAGSGLLMQMHYHPGGRVTNAPDATSVDLRLSDTAPTRRFVMGGWGNAGAAPALLPGFADGPGGPEFRIPAGSAHHVETMRFVVDIPAAPARRFPMFLMQPHQHYVGTELQMRIHRASPPPGEPADECLIQSDWNFDWQRTYQYDTAIEDLPTFGHGDLIEIECAFDNSLANPFVQRALDEMGLVAPIDVRLGEQSLDEMCLAIVGFID